PCFYFSRRLGNPNALHIKPWTVARPNEHTDPRERSHSQRYRYTNRSRAGLLRYAWVVGDDGTVALVNESLVRRGYAAFSDTGHDAAHAQRISLAQERAEGDEAGMWGACGGGHVPLSRPTPKPTKTPRPTAMPTEDTSTYVGGDGCTYRN